MHYVILLKFNVYGKFEMSFRNQFLHFVSGSVEGMII